MNRRSFIKRTVMAVGIGVAVGKVASIPVKVRAAKSLDLIIPGRSITFDLKRVNILFERERIGNMSEDFERWKNEPWEEVITVTRKDTGQIERRLISLTPMEADLGVDKVTIRGEFINADK